MCTLFVLHPNWLSSRNAVAFIASYFADVVHHPSVVVHCAN